MPNWTIDGGSFTDNPFHESALSRARYTLQNGGADSASFFLASSDAAVTPQLAEKDEVTLAYNAVVRFRGYVRSIAAVATGGAEGFSVELEGAMGNLARSPLLQRIAVAGAAGTYGYTGRVTLGYNDAGTRMNLAATITDLLSSTAARHGLATGAILTGHAVTAPLMDMSDASVAEALNRVLSWLPDCVLWFDHTANTVNVTKPANLAGVIIAGSGDGSGVVSITKDQKRRFAVPGVIISWETTSTYNGQQQISVTTDTAGVTTGKDVPAVTIPLNGVTVDTQSATLTTESIPRSAGDFTQAQWAAFLKRNFKEFENWNTGAYPDALVIVSCSQEVDSTHKSGLGTIPEFDPDGAGALPSAPAYPRELLSGAVPEWQSAISSAPVKVKIKVRPGANYDNINTPTIAAIFGQEEEYTREFTFECTGTDATTTTYSTVVNYVGGESPITGLAADWYTALNAAAPSFNVVLVGEEPRLDIYPGKKLTLTGVFGAVNAVVQAVTVDVDEGLTVITCGPQSRLTPADLVELMRAGSRRSPLANRSSGHRTSAAPSGRTIKGAAAARVKNTAVAVPKKLPFGFTPYLSVPGTVVVADGFVVHNAPNGDPISTFGGVVHGYWTRFSSLGFLTSVANNDYIWAKVLRGRTAFTIYTNPGAASSIQMDVWTFSTLTVHHGATMPSAATAENADIVPLGRYIITAGVEKVEIYHERAPIFCPFLVYPHDG